MRKLEDFLNECNISYKVQDFQADNFLENPFINNVETVDNLEIINNSGIDFSEFDKQFLHHFLKSQGVSHLTFYNSGKTISTYELVEFENKDDSYWEITETIPWSSVELDKTKNYLVFNKVLEEESGSMAYQQEDGYWYPSKKINGKSKIDFYSQLKERYNYLGTGNFFSMQGINVSEFRAVKDASDKSLETSPSILIYNYVPNKKIDKDVLHLDTKGFTSGKFLNVDDSIIHYLIGQEDSEKWRKFCKDHNIKVSPEFQKVLIELGIKNWVRESLVNPKFGLPITSQSFDEKQFFTIYVRRQQKQKIAKAVAVEFLYKDGYIYITRVLHDIDQIKKKFPIFRTLQNNPDILKNDQQYYVDEIDQIFISCYTNDLYTPTLIGRNGILEDLENESLEINRKKYNLLPLVLHYNKIVKQAMKNLICVDLKNKDFIQYFVPPMNIRQSIKNGFRVYHLLGKTYDKELIGTSELASHPLTALHFNTLTQNVLRVGGNSQSSLLQKVAKVLVEN